MLQWYFNLRKLHIRKTDVELDEVWEDTKKWVDQIRQQPYMKQLLHDLQIQLIDQEQLDFWHSGGNTSPVFHTTLIGWLIARLEHAITTSKIIHVIYACDFSPSAGDFSPLR